MNPPRRPAGSRGAIRTAVQLLGFGAGVALFVWCVRVVMSEENRAALENLKDARPWEIGALLAMGATSLVINGGIFRATLRPVRPLPVGDVVATNALATFLGYLPFKIGMFTRWVIHVRRDGVPVLMVGSWFVVVLGMMVLTVAPMGLVFLRPARWEGMRFLWWLPVVLGVVAAHALGWWAARFIQGERGVGRLRRVWVPERWLGSEWFAALHAGADMAADLRAVVVTTVLRVLDVVTFGLRFWVAAGVVGVAITPTEAVIIGLAYFVAGVVSPFGTVGLREAGALGMAAVAGVIQADAETEPLLTAILLVSVTEAVTSLVGAGVGAAWLRTDRLLVPVDPAEPAEPADPATPAPAAPQPIDGIPS